MSKRLYRSEKDKMLAGVCSGIAKYFRVDPILIRLAFVVLLISEFTLGLVLYIIAAIIIPEGKGKTEVGDVEVVDHPHAEEVNNTGSSRVTLAVVLIGLGVILLLYNLFPLVPFFSRYLAMFNNRSLITHSPSISRKAIP